MLRSVLTITDEPKKKRTPMQIRKLVGFKYEFYYSYTRPGTPTVKRKKPNGTMCVVALQFGLLIRTRKLFSLFYWCSTLPRLCKTYCLPSTCRLSLPVEVSIAISFKVSFLDYHLPLICELAKQLNVLINIPIAFTK